jgi:DNA processing protein
MALSAEQRDWLALTMVPGVGTAHFIRLLARFTTPGNVLRASEARLAEVVGPALSKRIRAYKEAADLDEQERRLKQYDAQLLTMDDPGYPDRLAEIYDPPLALFYRGTLLEEDANAVALVGTRKPSPYGIQVAERLARGLAERGITVVSGLASGIDAAAHQGAMDAGGRTIAVLGCGVDIVYPQENADLMHRITGHGCVLSQFAMGVKPSRGHFPYRNRIISGISLGVVIVEAPRQSGALITARQAAEQGREVFAVPGPITQSNSQGPHALIREGAKLVESVDDILVELNLSPEIRVQAMAAAQSQTSPARSSEPQEAPAPQKQATTATAPSPAPAPATAKAQAPQIEVTAKEKDILSVLAPEGSFVDEIALACRISVAEALSALTMLELKGLVRQFSGKRFTRR